MNCICVNESKQFAGSFNSISEHINVVCNVSQYYISTANDGVSFTKKEEKSTNPGFAGVKRVSLVTQKKRRSCMRVTNPEMVTMASCPWKDTKPSFILKIGQKV